jgi:hypothetical protein
MVPPSKLYRAFSLSAVHLGLSRPLVYCSGEKYLESQIPEILGIPKTSSAGAYLRKEPTQSYLDSVVRFRPNEGKICHYFMFSQILHCGVTLETK